MLLKYLHFFANFKFASSILIHTFLSIIKVFIQKIKLYLAFFQCHLDQSEQPFLSCILRHISTGWLPLCCPQNAYIHMYV